MQLTYILTQFLMTVNPDQTVGLRNYSTLGLSDQDQTVWSDLFTNLTQTLWLRLNYLAKFIHYPINIKFKKNLAMLERYGPSYYYCMGLLLKLLYALFSFSFPFFFFFFLFLSFFFFFSFISFSNYLQNEKSFVNKNTRDR